MVWIDNLIIAIVVLSMLVGFFRGFFPELLSVLTWIAAIWLAWQYAPLISPRLEEALASPVLSEWAARLIIFVVAVLLGSLLTQAVSLVISKTGLGGTDRMLGLVFGLVRGIIVLGVIVIFAQMLGFDRERWWQQSRLIPAGERVAGWMRGVLPGDLAGRIEAATPAEPAE